MTSRYASVPEPVSSSSSSSTSPRAALDLSPIPRLPGRVPSALVERISTKLQAAFWVAGAVLLLTKGGVYEMASDPARSNPFFVYLGLGALALSVALGVYCVVIVPRLYGSNWGWDIVAPGMVEVATLASVTGFISFCIGLWPALGLLTPLVVGFIAMGAVLSTHFIPVW